MIGGHTGVEILADLWVNRKPELLENTKSLMFRISLETSMFQLKTITIPPQGIHHHKNDLVKHGWVENIAIRFFRRC